MKRTTFDLWNATEPKACAAARGRRCAEATDKVTRWVVEMP